MSSLRANLLHKEVKMRTLMLLQIMFESVKESWARSAKVRIIITLFKKENLDVRINILVYICWQFIVE